MKTTKDNCFFCGIDIDDYSRTVDHLIPQCDGGIRSNDNKVYCCRSCNQLKANMHPQAFVDFLETVLRFEHLEHKKKIGYLKKIKLKTVEMIKTKSKKGNK